MAVNLRGVGRDVIARGSALLTPGRFRFTDLIDVRLHGDPVAGLPATVTLHAGSAAVPVRVRPLGADTAEVLVTLDDDLVVSRRKNEDDDDRAG